MKDTNNTNIGKEPSGMIRLRMKVIDEKITFVPETDYWEEPKRTPTTPEEIRQIRFSRIAPYFDYEGRRIRVRKVTAEGFEYTDFIDLQRDASTARQIAYWIPFEEDETIHYAASQVADELLYALQQTYDFGAQKVMDRVADSRPAGEDDILYDSLKDIVRFLEKHKAHVDWASLKVVYGKGTE